MGDPVQIKFSQLNLCFSLNQNNFSILSTLKVLGTLVAISLNIMFVFIYIACVVIYLYNVESVLCQKTCLTIFEYALLHLSLINYNVFNELDIQRYILINSCWKSKLH